MAHAYQVIVYAKHSFGIDAETGEDAEAYALSQVHAGTGTISVLDLNRETKGTPRGNGSLAPHIHTSPIRTCETCQRKALAAARFLADETDILQEKAGGDDGR